MRDLPEVFANKVREVKEKYRVPIALGTMTLAAHEALPGSDQATAALLVCLLEEGKNDGNVVDYEVMEAEGNIYYLEVTWRPFLGDPWNRRIGVWFRPLQRVWYSISNPRNATEMKG